MTYHETAAQARFRVDVRALLADPATHELLTTPPPGCELDPRPVYRLLGERGWLAPHWPERYGGLEAGPVEAGIVTEELALSGVTDSGYVNTVQNAGAFLLLAGTDAQRDRFLPPMAAGDLLVSILYSEPEAGSDLASLQSQAERVDGGWRLRGRKVYNVLTPLADYGLCAARTSTGPVKYAGITLFMVPLRGSAVSVRPIPTMGADRFYDVCLEGVALDDEDVIGDVGDGWTLISTALAIERTGLDFNAKVRRWWRRTRDLAQATGALEDDRVADELVELRARLDAGRALAWRLVHDLAEDRIDPAQAAMSKWFNSELGRDVAAAAARLDGLSGDVGASLADVYREAPAITVAGGTSHVMLYLAASELGL